MFSIRKNKIKDESSKSQNNINESGKGSGKALFSVYFGITGIVLVSVIIFIVKISLSPKEIGDFSFLTNSVSAEGAASKKLFAEPVKNLSSDSPELTFVQDNSIVGVSSPLVISPSTLGSVIENDEADSRDDGGVIEYIVESDDTLASIAQKFNISTDTIKWANGMTGKTVKPGQTLVILPVSGVLHLVKDGDTMGNIAKKYKAAEGDIIAFNSLKDENDIFVGDMLVVPGGKKPAEVKSPKSIPGIPLAESYFIFPVEGKISQGLHGALYAAVDIATSCGKPIVAAAGGKVQRAGFIAVGGNIVTILHSNGVVTYYGHMSTIAVRPGQIVSAGDIIGYVGKTGYATGCHVHFETRGASNFLGKYPLGSYISWKK